MITKLKTLMGRLRSAAMVIGGLPESPSYNGSVFLIDDVEAMTVVRDIDAAVEFLADLSDLLDSNSSVAAVNPDMADGVCEILNIPFDKPVVSIDGGP